MEAMTLEQVRGEMLQHTGYGNPRAEDADLSRWIAAIDGHLASRDGVAVWGYVGDHELLKVSMGKAAQVLAKPLPELGITTPVYLRAHLAQPAQAVDVGVIREVIETLRTRKSMFSGDLGAEADKLIRALSAEKAGWRDGWREFIEGCANSAGGRVDGTHLSERAKCLLAGSNGEAWTLDSDGHKTYWPSAEIAERERTNLAVLGHPATVIPPSFYGWRAAFHAQRAAAMRAHTICYETMQAHPEVAELGDDGRLHDAIHDILRIDGPASPTPDKEG